MSIAMSFKKSLLVLSAFAIIGSGLFYALSPDSARATTPLSSVVSGDLIRGTTYSAVYYMGANGLRYVFPNSNTYFTWYSNFDSVKFLSDTDLSKIQIGGNVTYRPGVKMIKINSDPKVYAVGQNGALRWVGTESIATALYGSTWNKQIDDMPDGFFSNYTISDPIQDSSQFVPATVTAGVANINYDKTLEAAATISIGSTGYSPISVTIHVGGTVKFTNNDTIAHTATSDSLTWGTGTLKAGESFISTFKTAGTYTFFDSYNSQNTGAIYVQ
ncbi:MAG: cupredoxin domain-containing protein [Patescibacteria group bacterium]|jgi:plastocyanin